MELGRSPHPLVPGVSEKQIRLELAREAETADKDHTPEERDAEDKTKGIHPSLFIAQGLQLEDDQCVPYLGVLA